MKVTKRLIKVYEVALKNATKEYAIAQEEERMLIPSGLCYHIDAASGLSVSFYHENEYVRAFYNWCRKERLITANTHIVGYWWDRDEFDLRLLILRKYVEHLKSSLRKINTLRKALKDATQEYDNQRSSGKNYIIHGLCYFICRNTDGWGPGSGYHSNSYVIEFYEWVKKEKKSNMLQISLSGYWWQGDDIDTRIKVLKEYIKHLKENWNETN